MLKSIFIFVFTYLNIILCFGQTFTNKNLQFEDNQVDSIIKSHLQILNKDSFFIAHTVSYSGSYIYNNKLGKHYSNPFQLIMYYKNKGEYYAILVNNFGINSRVKDNLKDLKNFLINNLNQMQSEELSKKKDTILLKDGTIKISSEKTDHQRYDMILISYKGEIITYNFPAEYESNKWNLFKKRYLFLKQIQEHSDKLVKKLKQ